jgi:hypothetical protein
MSDSVLQYEEKMWELFDVTKNKCQTLPKPIMVVLKMPYTAMVPWI